MAAVAKLDGIDVIVPLNMFTRSRREDGSLCLVAEISDIECWCGRRGVKLQRFAIQGERAEVVFRFDRVDRTPDGEDVAGWYFKPEDGQEHAMNNRAVEVLIIND